jgi:hypothetical protein
MNNISEYNYEAYFLDYHEGRLDEAATKELMDFLTRHPELKHEFESFESVSLTDIEEIKFENKESLKKNVAPVNAASFDDMAIEYVEGNLNPLLTEELLKFTKQNPKYERELATYRKTKLVPEAIIFEDKESLKRIPRKRPTAWYYWSAAASVALLVGVYFLINKGNDQSTVNIVSTNHLVDTTKHIQPAINNSATNTLAQNNSVNNVTVQKTVQHLIHHSARHAGNNNTVAKINKQDTNTAIAVHINNAIKKQDSIAPHSTNDIAVKNTDTATHKPDVQQAPVYVSHYSAPEEKNKSVFTLASNTVKSIRRFFKHNIGVNRYIDKDTDKVIAYQLTLGDNRYTLPIRNNSY